MHVKLAVSEQFILELLVALGPSYGLQLVGASRNRLKRGGIYVTLGRMEAKGLVNSVQGDGGRRIYRPTALGDRALTAAHVFSGRIRLPAKA